MQFKEAIEGEFRIFVGAMESLRGDGYTAALAVQRVAAAGQASGRLSARPAYREDSLACGHRWASADEAMRYALRKGRDWIRAEATA